MKSNACTYALSLLLLSVVFSLTGCDRVANASTDAAAITIERPIRTVILKRGEVSTDSVKVKNQTPNDLVVDVRSANLEPRKKNSLALNIEELNSDTGSENLGQWLRVRPKNAEIKSGTERTFRFDISTPVDAQKRGAYGVLIFSFQNKRSSGVVNLVQESSVVLLGRMVGVDRRHTDASLVAQDKITFGDKNSGWNLSIKNKGDTHESYSGWVKIKPLFGQAKRVEIKPFILLPSEERHQTLMLPKRLFIPNRISIKHIELIAVANTVASEPTTDQGSHDKDASKIDIRSVSSIYVAPSWLWIVGVALILVTVIRRFANRSSPSE